jgi:hypothetical protein
MFLNFLEKKMSNLKKNSSMSEGEIEAINDINKIMSQNPDFYDQNLTDTIYNLTRNILIN